MKAEHLSDLVAVRLIEAGNGEDDDDACASFRMKLLGRETDIESAG